LNWTNHAPGILCYYYRISRRYEIIISIPNGFSVEVSHSSTSLLKTPILLFKNESFPGVEDDL